MPLLELPAETGRSKEFNMVKKKRTYADDITDRAIARCHAAANPAWKVEVLFIIGELAKAKRTLTADDVWAIIYQVPDFPKTHEPRAMGGVFREAARDGVIRLLDVHTNTMRPVAHRRPMHVWGSLIYKGS